MKPALSVMNQSYTNVLKIVKIIWMEWKTLNKIKILQITSYLSKTAVISFDYRSKYTYIFG